MTVTIRVTKHIGRKRRYFADPELQALYETMISGRGTTLVTKEAIAFLDRLGVEHTESREGG